MSVEVIEEVDERPGKIQQKLQHKFPETVIEKDFQGI